MVKDKGEPIWKKVFITVGCGDVPLAGTTTLFQIDVYLLFLLDKCIWSLLVKSTSFHGIMFQNLLVVMSSHRFDAYNGWIIRSTPNPNQPQFPRGLVVRVPDWWLSGSEFEAGRMHTVWPESYDRPAGNWRERATLDPGDRVAIYLWYVKLQVQNLPVNRAQAMWSGGGSVVSRNKPGLGDARALRHPLNRWD